jgi:hypothetical protein
MIAFRVCMTMLVLIQGGLSCAGESAMKSRKSNIVNPLADTQVDNNISYQTLCVSGGPEDAIGNTTVPRKSKGVVPISNIPSDNGNDSANDTSIPSNRDFVIYRLKRRVEALRADEKRHLAKLSRALAELQDLQRYFDLGMHYDQWPTYDELIQRRLHLQAIIDLLRDPVAESPVDEEKRKQVL